MRFATYSADGLARSGVVSDAGLHPLPDGVSVLHLVRAAAANPQADAMSVVVITGGVKSISDAVRA